MGVATAGVAGHGGKQVRVVIGPASDHTLLLGADLAFEFLIDRHGGLAAHLVVQISQVGGLLPVVEQTVEGQRTGIGGA
jgi:hypothetical protein